MKEMQVDPETLMRDLTCYDTIRQTEEQIRPMAFTEEQARGYVREKNKDACVVTVESVLAEMREFLDKRVEWWGWGKREVHSVHNCDGFRESGHPVTSFVSQNP